MAGELLSTQAVSQPERFAYWRDLICDTFVQLDASAPQPQSFSGHLRRQQLHDLQITEVRASAQHVIRSPSQIRKAREESFLVSIQLSGQGLVRQQGRAAPIGAGQFALYDSTRPYELQFDGAFRQLVLHLPRARLEPLLAAPHLVTACAVDGTHGLGRVALGMIQSAWLEGSDLPPEQRRTLEDAVVDVLCACLNSLLGQAGRQTDAVRLAAAQAFITEHLADPLLSPDLIARALHLSVRSLHALYAGQSRTLMETVRDLRLERCHQALCRPLDNHRSVTEVAFSWGFNDMSHFSRAFRTRYGRSPSEVRFG